MMQKPEHIIWQKRTTNCFFPLKRRPESPYGKKSELIVNFGEDENAPLYQF
jgi:hypothetical protein